MARDRPVEEPRRIAGQGSTRPAERRWLRAVDPSTATASVASCTWHGDHRRRGARRRLRPGRVRPAIRLRAGYRGTGSLEAWLWRIVVNAARDRARAASAPAASERPAETDALAQEPPGGTSGPRSPCCPSYTALAGADARPGRGAQAGGADADGGRLDLAAGGTGRPLAGARGRQPSLRLRRARLVDALGTLRGPSRRARPLPLVDPGSRGPRHRSLRDDELHDRRGRPAARARSALQRDRQGRASLGVGSDAARVCERLLASCREACRVSGCPGGPLRSSATTPTTSRSRGGRSAMPRPRPERVRGSRGRVARGRSRGHGPRSR